MSKVTRRALLASTAAAAWSGEALARGWIHGSAFGQGASTPLPPVINGATVNPTVFPGGDPDGTVVGAVSVNISGGSFTGTLAVTGTDAASFRLSSSTLPSNLLLNGTVAAGTYAINIVPTQAGATNSGTAYPQTITGSMPGVGTTVSFVNTGSSSPAATPIRCRQWFTLGNVPTGSIAVPQIGGVDATYNASDLCYWGDGSLMGGTFFISGGTIAGGGTSQITFDVRNGAYSYTSAITTATVTGETDFKLSLRNVHTASLYQSSAYNVAASVNVSGGAVTGGTVFYPPGWTTVNHPLNNSIAALDTSTILTTSVASFTTGSYYAIDSEIVKIATISSGSSPWTVVFQTVTWVTNQLTFPVVSWAGTTQPIAGNVVSISGATNTGSGGSAAINTSFTVVSATSTQVVLSAVAAPGVFGTIAGAPVVIVGSFPVPTTRQQLGTTAASHSAGATIRLLWDVRNGGGVNASVYSVAGTIVVNTGGSGYTAPSSFTNSFNTGIGVVNGSGNNVGAYLVQYAKGPACDAWRLRFPTPSLPQHHVTWYIERWKKTDGTLMAYYAYGMVGNGMVDAVNSLFDLTFDADFQNGATVFAGDSNGTPGWTKQCHFMAGDWGTFDTQARGFWTANDAAYKAVVQQRSPIECDQLKATGIVAWLALAPTIPVPTTPAAYENSVNGGRAFLCTYQPMGTSGCRAPAGSGGAGNTENPMGSEVNAAYWMALRTGTTGSATWMQNSRVGAAHACGSCQTGGSMYDKINLFYPCTVPSSAHTFTGMTQSSTVYSDTTISLQKGEVHPILDAKGTISVGTSPYHQSCYAVFPFIIEGERWQLDAIANSCSTVLYGQSPTFVRQATIGSTTFYAILCNQPGNVRVQAWHKRTLGYGGIFSPVTLPDGSTNVEQAYLQYALKSHYDYLNALIPYTGATVKFGSGSPVHAKSLDFTGAGVWPEQFFALTSGPQEIDVPFMNDYEMQVNAIMGWLWQGTATGTSIQAFRDYIKISFVKLWAYSGSHYLNDSYRINAFVGQPPANPSDITWSSMGDITTPLLGIFQNNSAEMAFTASSSTVNLFVPGAGAASIFYQGTTRIATGSRIKLTNTLISNYGNTAGSLPPEINPAVWYYYKEITPTTCELYTDAGLTTKITPSTTVAAKSFWCVPANTPLADNSGKGTYNGGGTIGGTSRIGVKLGTMRLLQAMGMADDTNGNVTNAIANCATIFNSLPGQNGFANQPEYAWDSSLT